MITFFGRVYLIKLSSLLFISILFLGGQVQASVKETARITKSFNNDWRFTLGDPENAQSRRFNDRNWRLLNVHTTGVSKVALIRTTLQVGVADTYRLE